VKKNNIPQTLSTLLHPLLMPSFGLLALFFSGTYISFLTYEAKKSIFLIVLTFTFILPASLTPFYTYRNIIRSAQLKSQKERPIPMFITGVLFYIAYYILWKFSVPRLIQLFLLASTISASLALLITLKWKISTHMIGIGGVTGMLLALSFRLYANVQLFIIMSILVAGIIGTCRIWLNAHKPCEVYAGYLLGLAVSFLIILLG
jgi:hypothetical protein